jgi:hypothetical protein
MERVARSRRLDWLERWEMDRKIRRLNAPLVGHDPGPTAATEVRYDSQVCKGHVGGHRERTLVAFNERMARIDEVAGWPAS